MVGYVLLIVTAGLGRVWWSTEAWLLLAGLATAAVLAAAPVRFPTRDRPAWLSLALAAVMFTVADAVFSVGAARPVRVVDVLYAPAAALVLFALYRMDRQLTRAAGYLDAAVLAAGLAVLIVAVFTMRTPQADADNLILLYPLAGVVILALTIRLICRVRTQASWLMLAAAVWLLASSFVPALFGYPMSATLLQILHIGMLGCWGLAAQLPPPEKLGAVEAVDRRPPIWLFAVVVLLAPAALLIGSGVDPDTREVVLAVACAGAGLYVVARLGSLARAGTTDPVTGLMFMPVLLIDARAQLAAGKEPTLYLMDLEQFHVVNESGGRPTGDRVLRQIGQELSQAAGDAQVARGSLYRFAVLAELPSADGDAARLADRMSAAVTRPVTVDGQRLDLTCSVGYATAASADVDDLIVNSEAALQAAKSAGPGTRIAYHQGLREADLERAALIADLRVAIGAGQLLLEYQPIVALDDGLIEGFEALVRWQHPRLGRLGPDCFVDLAESAGLIGDLGAWVLHQGIAGTAALNAAARRPIFVDINVSAAQFGPRLAKDLCQGLADHAVNASLIVLELTETMLIPDRHWLAGELTALKELGVRVAIDDFGTGHSSLARLKQLPIDLIKIDRMFVDGLTPGGPAQMISGILQIAASLNVDAVAEGIEQTSERDLLAKLGCRLGQGYLYSKPVALAQAKDLIQAGPIIE
jgi:diguanylate cyclase (GGDEF)-like protein